MRTIVFLFTTLCLFTTFACSEKREAIDNQDLNDYQINITGLEEDGTEKAGEPFQVTIYFKNKMETGLPFTSFRIYNAADGTNHRTPIVTEPTPDGSYRQMAHVTTELSLAPGTEWVVEGKLWEEGKEDSAMIETASFRVN